MTDIRCPVFAPSELGASPFGYDPTRRPGRQMAEVGGQMTGVGFQVSGIRGLRAVFSRPTRHRFLSYGGSLGSNVCVCLPGRSFMRSLVCVCPLVLSVVEWAANIIFFKENKWLTKWGRI